MLLQHLLVHQPILVLIMRSLSQLHLLRYQLLHIQIELTLDKMPFIADTQLLLHQNLLQLGLAELYLLELRRQDRHRVLLLLFFLGQLNPISPLIPQPLHHLLPLLLHLIQLQLQPRLLLLQPLFYLNILLLYLVPALLIESDLLNFSL